MYRMYPNNHYFDNIGHYMTVRGIVRVENEWYKDAYGYCEALAQNVNLSVSQVVAICALYSQGSRWQQNQRWLEQTVADYKAGRVVAYGRFPNQLRPKVASIIKNGPIVGHNVSGQKVTRFYANITGDLALVTIDRFMVRLCRGDFWSTKERDAKPSKKEYPLMARAIKDHADRLGVNPADLQAELWINFRGSAK